MDPGRTWRTHVWRRAKAEGLPKVGIETVRRHVRRAAALGLSYQRYAAIRIGTGRDVRALLFSGAALGLRRGAPLATPYVARLSAISDCERLLLGEAPPAAAGDAGLFDDAAPAPPPHATLPEGREAIRNLLRPRALPGDAVVMIGDGALGDGAEPAWADAARLARFLSHEVYFSGP